MDLGGGTSSKCIWKPREIENGNELSDEVICQLQNLIESDTPSIETLALLIKDQKINLNDQDLKDLLVTLSKNKIAVDNPNYSTFKKLIKWLKRFFVSKNHQKWHE